MSIVQDLLAEITAFIGERGITETTFGRMAVNDGKLLGRLRAGSTVTIATVDRARAFIAAERSRASQPEPAVERPAIERQPGQPGEAPDAEACAGEPAQADQQPEQSPPRPAAAA